MTCSFDVNEILESSMHFYPREITDDFLSILFESLEKESGNSKEGINFPIFRNFINLPLFLSKKIYLSIDSLFFGKVKEINKDTFISLISTIYFNTLSEFETFLFNFLDFDHDGIINVTDVKLIAYNFHYTINNDYETNSNFLQTQSIIDQIINSIFIGENEINFEKYEDINRNLNSDLLLLFIDFFTKTTPISKQQFQFYYNKISQSEIPLVSSYDDHSIFDYIIPSSTLRKYLNTFKESSLDDSTFEELNEFENDIKNAKSTFCNNYSPKSDRSNSTKDNSFDNDKAILCKTNENVYDYQIEGIIYFNGNKINNNKNILYFIGNIVYIFDINQCFHTILVLNKVLNIYKYSNYEGDVLQHHVNFYFIMTNHPSEITITFSSLTSMNNFYDFISNKHHNLFDEYELNEKNYYKEGIFGKIYTSINKNTNQTVIIKKLSKFNSIDGWEASICSLLKNIQHQNIIRIIDVFEDISNVYIVMEKADNCLRDYLMNSAQNLPQILDTFFQISQGISCLHSLGIIHRDIKIDNIVYNEKNNKIQFKLIDFGLSKIIGSGEYASETYGTFCYMPPEIIKKLLYNFKVDIWSLGVTFFVIYKKRLPFCDNSNKEIGFCDTTQTSMVDLVFNILNRTITIKPGEDSSLEEKTIINAINKCLMKNINNRPNIKDLCKILSKCS